MKRSQICISFVGIFKKPLAWIPDLGNQFCRDLFGKPYDTMNGMTPDGYTIAINGKPFPMAVISPERFIVKAENRDCLIGYIEQLKAALESKGLKDLGFSSFGINWEYQWLELPANADIWMCEHFVKASLFEGRAYHVCNKLNLRVSVNDTQFVNMDLEPRVGIRDGLYANINHHHGEIMDSIPDSHCFQKYIQESEGTVLDVVSSLIG